ncbi:hypothetical protein [Paracoccus tegillarcae]|uniref:Uncharacterized protein n=1 Tax=Paracoccus tegillarcae TaxID=1529068 RepID=A0A2K9EZ61_9RHOB|nr:hypothetical protein [Paracoccus tegillarcae]AUH33392.1 hypothetical protein CUV01_08310 [Paracoccus tegillarcae]
MSAHSILLLAYGQSNSDVYPAKPAQACDAFNDPRIVTFDDGNAFRGLLGALPKAPVTALVPAASASYETKKCRDYQSFQIAAAARLFHEGAPEGLRQVIVRAEGRGGRRFHGIVKNERHIEGILDNADGTDSQILLNMLETIRIAAEMAAGSGAPLRRIIVNFIHGEADRSTPRDFYRKNFEALIARVAELAAQLGVEVDWLILDPAGTASLGSGNNWPCRLAMQEVADAYDNVHLIGGGYGYELDDVIHYSSASRALFGEHFGAAIAALLAGGAGGAADTGWLLSAPRIERAVLSGRQVELHLGGDKEFQLVPGISDPNLNCEGFDVTLATRCQIEAVQQTGPRSVRVTLEKPPIDDHRAALTYAYQIIHGKDNRMDSLMPAGRGGWRSVAALESMVLPGRRIHQWVPGFFMPFAEMEQG